MLYRFGDLTLASDEPFSQLPEDPTGLPECSFERARGSGPLVVETGWDHHWRAPGGAVALSCARDGNGYRLGMPDVATFVIDEPGRTITCRAQTGLSHDTLEHAVIDQVLPRVLTHRGRLVLHAGCVVTPLGAIAFLGESGAGKSTLCAAFAREGDPLLGDDGIVVRRARAGGFDALATYPGLRLLPDPLASLFDGAARSVPMARHSSKRRLDVGGAGCELAAGPVALRAVYLLDAGADVRIAPLAGRDAFVTLVRSCFQMHLEDAERARDLFDRIGAVIDAVPVRRLSFPRDYARLPEVREALLDDAGR